MAKSKAKSELSKLYKVDREGFLETGDFRYLSERDGIYYLSIYGREFKGKRIKPDVCRKDNACYFHIDAGTHIHLVAYGIIYANEKTGKVWIAGDVINEYEDHLGSSYDGYGEISEYEGSQSEGEEDSGVKAVESGVEGEEEKDVKAVGVSEAEGVEDVGVSEAEQEKGVEDVGVSEAEQEKGVEAEAEECGEGEEEKKGVEVVGEGEEKGVKVVGEEVKGGKAVGEGQSEAEAEESGGEEELEKDFPDSPEEFDLYEDLYKDSDEDDVSCEGEDLDKDSDKDEFCEGEGEEGVKGEGEEGVKGVGEEGVEEEGVKGVEEEDVGVGEEGVKGVGEEGVKGVEEEDEDEDGEDDESDDGEEVVSVKEEDEDDESDDGEKMKGVTIDLSKYEYHHLTPPLVVKIPKEHDEPLIDVKSRNRWRGQITEEAVRTMRKHMADDADFFEGWIDNERMVNYRGEDCFTEIDLVWFGMIADIENEIEDDEIERGGAANANANDGSSSKSDERLEPRTDIKVENEGAVVDADDVKEEIEVAAEDSDKSNKRKLMEDSEKSNKRRRM